MLGWRAVLCIYGARGGSAECYYLLLVSEFASLFICCFGTYTIYKHREKCFVSLVGYDADVQQRQRQWQDFLRVIFCLRPMPTLPIK